MSVPSSSQSGSSPPGAWEPPSLEDMQAWLAQYEFVSLIGRGGMGAVYKARQVSLDRMVAIKVLPGDLLDDADVNFVERFKQEARTMARMNHPAIVGVFDFGETAHGLLYFVMEFVDGTDVARMITSSGALPSAHALAITAHVCDALAYAHSHGVVHRDIKPANVLINMEGQVKVADFGLAKASDASEAGLTKTNIAMGTPDFVAPEALIAGMPIDGRADLYAVGVMLYQMLTGQIPRGMWSMPSARVGADPRFDAIIAKAMQTDREVRYQTAHDVRTDLDRILTMPIIQAGGQSSVAIPKQAVQQQQRPTGQKPTGQKPTGQGPRPAGQKPVSTPSKQHPQRAPEPPPPKASAGGLYWGVGAAALLTLGAFFVFPRQQTAPDGAAAIVTEAPPTPPENRPVALPSPAASVNKSPAPAANRSPERVFAYGGHSYRLVLEKMEWGQAMAKAATMGGHLVTINSKEEAEWVKRTFRPFLIGDDLVLAGGQRKTLDDPWQWLTGEPMTFRGWGTGWPDGNNTRSMVLALHLDQARPGWDDVALDKKSSFLVEWDSYGGTPPGLAPKEVINLLAQVNLGRDTVKGSWKKVFDGVEVGNSGEATILEFGYEPPEEYDYIVEFTPKGEGEGVTQLLSAQDRAFSWKMKVTDSAGLYGFDLLGGKNLHGRPEASAKLKNPPQTGQRYRSEIQVRKDGLRALVDGDEVVNWRGDFKQLSREDEYTLRNFRDLGLGTAGRSVVFQRAEVRVVSQASVAVAAAPVATAMPAPDTSVMKAPAPAGDPRLAQLESGFQARYAADVQKPYLAAVALLNQSYINSGIARARAAAQARGSLVEVALLDDEKRLIASGQSLPATDADALPASLLQLRKTFRDSLARYAAEGDGKASALYAIYVKALDDYVIELTKANRIDEAQQVRSLRNEIAEKAAQKETPRTAAATTTTPAVAEAGAPLTLFDGKSLEGWKVTGDAAAFSIDHGMIKATGGKGNLFFVGTGAKPPAWKDFNLTMKVKTGDKANSGVWIHSKAETGTGSAALEVQIANENSDAQKTGSLWAVKPVDKMRAKDGEWFDLRVSVKGRRVTVYVNDKEVCDWTQPTNWEPPTKVPNARLGEGTVGLQSNVGTAWFKDIQITPG